MRVRHPSCVIRSTGAAVARNARSPQCASVSRIPRPDSTRRSRPGSTARRRRFALCPAAGAGEAGAEQDVHVVESGDHAGTSLAVR
jgi:hypothetical protein